MALIFAIGPCMKSQRIRRRAAAIARKERSGMRLARRSNRANTTSDAKPGRRCRWRGQAKSLWARPFADRAPDASEPVLAVDRLERQGERVFRSQRAGLIPKRHRDGCIAPTTATSPERCSSLSGTAAVSTAESRRPLQTFDLRLPRGSRP